jgi:hypothetical protein
MSAVRGVMWALGTPVRALLIGAIRLYQVTLSGWMGGRCKYYPSCSRYAAEAIQTHGALRGAALATWRLLRCNPLSPGGVDHVPPGHERPARAGPYDAVSHQGTDDLKPDRVEA